MAEFNSIVGAKLCDNFYIRGLDGTGDEDHGKINSATKGTGCYFFDLEGLQQEWRRHRTEKGMGEWNFSQARRLIE